MPVLSLSGRLLRRVQGLGELIWGVQSRPAQEHPEAAGKDVGAGEATFDGAGPLPTHGHLWDLQRICAVFCIMLVLILFLKKQVVKSFC